jgi:hypothetical protein
VLTRFQEEIAGTVAEVVQPEGFALAGGAALILQGIVDRQTRDLDFFAQESASVNQVCPSVETALRTKGMDVIRCVDAPGFIRLEVTRGDEFCEVDLGSDARILPAAQTAFGPVLATEELAADKVLALFGRAAARDFVDVYSLSKLFGEERLCELAAQKDRGFDQGHFADALGAFSRLDRDLFEVDHSSYANIRTWAASWRSRLLERSIDRSQPEVPLDRGDDMGLGR